MALTYQGRVNVSVPVIDATGSTAQIRFTVALPNLEDAESVLNEIQTNINSILLLTGGAARSMTVSFPWADPTPSAPSPGSRVERLGQWLVSAGGRKTGLFTIPAIRDGFIDGIGYIIRSAAAVQALENFLTTRVMLTDGSDITGILDAREVFRASRRAAPRLRR